uniref:Cytochrome P450 n=1 Tax=Timema poppense TaxID=170557 RepID=A0A7R9D5K3_TIMPO|nr:unnamed protein product [Timema poppensis]
MHIGTLYSVRLTIQVVKRATITFVRRKADLANLLPKPRIIHEDLKEKKHLNLNDQSSKRVEKISANLFEEKNILIDTDLKFLPVHPSTSEGFNYPSVEMEGSRVTVKTNADHSAALVDIYKEQQDKLKLALPFDEVPGPRILKILAKIWKYIPLVGTQITASAMVYFINMLGTNLTWNRATRPFNHMFNKYGPVVRLQGPFGGDIVFLSRPEHIEMVYRQEGRYPVRSSLDSLEHYRLTHRRLRNVGPFIIIRLLRNRQEEMPASFSKELYNWGIECVGLVTLDKHLGCLDPVGLKATSESLHLVEAITSASEALRRCEAGFQMWRFFKTKDWQRLVTYCDVIDSIVSKHIDTSQSRLKNEKQSMLEEGTRWETERSLVDALLLTHHLHPEDVLTIVLDMLLIGVNATSHALSFLLYHLARNPRAQKQLFKEVSAALPSRDSSLSPDSLHKMIYLHACIKESLRLQPPIPVLTRVLPEDIAVHSYKIPQGTCVLMTSHVTCLREENFEDALKFKPERWLVSDQDIHPFAAIPFGYGPRSCLGRGIAELQLWMTVAKVIRNFQIEYHYSDIQATTKLIAMPNKPLKFRFVDRVK